MNPKAVLLAGLLCFVLVMSLAAFTQPAYAQDDAPKTGLGEVFKKRAPTGTGPTKNQLILVAVATVVTIAVVKYV